MLRQFLLCLICIASALRSVRADCLSDPGNAACALYMYPDDRALADVGNLCFEMPWMIGCSIWNACDKGDMPSSSPYCEPFSILGDICVDSTMAGMSGCKSWKALCSPSNSTVQQCEAMAPIPRIVFTTESQMAVVDSCSDHNMEGCDECTGLYSQCNDTLHSLQTVCLGMRMEMCNDYNSMCSAAGSGLDYFCTAKSAGYDPPMRMYFHGGISDFILFRKWVPRSNGAYFGAIMACLLAGIFVSALRAYRACCEAYYRVRDNLHIRHMPHEVSNASIFVVERGRVIPHMLRSVLTFVMVLIDYSLMLAAMSFNTGIFFAVVGGLALGMLLFGHIPERYSQRIQANAILASDIECGCGTMITNKPKDFSDDGAGAKSLSASSLAEVSALPPSCCGSKCPDFETVPMTGDDVDVSVTDSEPPVKLRGKVCCTMKPILDAEEDTQKSCADQAGEMVPQCCRM